MSVGMIKGECNGLGKVMVWNVGMLILQPTKRFKLTLYSQHQRKYVVQH